MRALSRIQHLGNKNIKNHNFNNLPRVMCYSVKALQKSPEMAQFGKSLGTVQRRYFEIIMKSLESLKKKSNQTKVKLENIILRQGVQNFKNNLTKLGLVTGDVTFLEDEELLCIQKMVREKLCELYSQKREQIHKKYERQSE